MNIQICKNNNVTYSQSTNQCNQIVRTTSCDKVIFLDYLKLEDAERWLNYMIRLGYDYEIDEKNVIIHLDDKDNYKRYCKFICFRAIVMDPTLFLVLDYLDNNKPSRILAPLFAHYYYTAFKKTKDGIHFNPLYFRFLFNKINLKTYQKLYTLSYISAPITLEQFNEIGNKKCGSINTRLYDDIKSDYDSAYIHCFVQQNIIDYHFIKPTKNKTQFSNMISFLNEELEESFRKKDFKFNNTYEDFLGFYKFYMNKCKNNVYSDEVKKIQEFYKNK